MTELKNARLEDKLITVFLTISISLNSWALYEIVSLARQMSAVRANVEIILHHDHLN